MGDFSSGTVLFEHPDVITVTCGRVVTPRRTYAVANITSVAVRTVPDGTGWATMLLIAVIATGFGMLLALSQVVSAADPQTLSVFLTAVGINIFVTILLVWFLLSRPPIHVLVVYTQDGAQRALTSKDENLIRGAEEAIKLAIGIL